MDVEIPHCSPIEREGGTRQKGVRPNDPDGQTLACEHPSQHPQPMANRRKCRNHNQRLGLSGSNYRLQAGNSITLAAYHREENTFVRRIEHMSRWDGLNWETVNAAVAGTSVNNPLSILMETGSSITPDVVVVGFYLNDFLDSYGVYIEQAPSIFRYSWLANYLYKSISTHRSEPTIDYTVFHSDRNASQKLDATKVNRQQ